MVCPPPSPTTDLSIAILILLSSVVVKIIPLSSSVTISVALFKIDSSIAILTLLSSVCVKMIPLPSSVTISCPFSTGLSSFVLLIFRNSFIF